MNVHHEPLPSVVERDGLHLAGTELWFDARARRPLCFVSGVQRKPARAHGTTIMSDTAAAILAHLARRPSRVGNVLTAPFGHEVRLGPLRLQLLPAGGLPGNSQLLVHHRGVRVLYAGALTLQTLPLAPAADATEAALVLAVAATAPADAPTREAQEAAVLRAVVARTAARRRLVMVADPLGPAVELVELLVRRGVPFAAHPTVVRAVSAFAATGTPRLADVRPAEGAAVELWPPSATHTKKFQERATRNDIDTVVLGAAAVSTPVERLAWDTRPTERQLVEWLAAAAPERVVLVGPNAARVAERLVRKGIEAVALSGAGQLPLL